MIPAEMAESKVIETILGMAHSSNIGVESTNVQARTRDIEQEITELKEALTRIDLEWEEGFILKDAYLEKRQGYKPNYRVFNRSTTPRSPRPGGSSRS